MGDDGRVHWSRGTWLNAPPEARVEGSDLVVTAGRGSDFWRTTAYGFVRDSGHALLAPLADGRAVEVGFVLDYTELYDQAGVLLRVDEQTWVKAGVEISDGLPQLGAVATRGVSDWSVAPVPDWAGGAVTVRASRAGDAVTVRARVAGQPWRMVRVAPLPPDRDVLAGPFCCAPERAGLAVRFVRWADVPADTGLHEEPPGG
jgi:regulation of enolase protein 1 (concanavalin A-like superfamily)